MLNETIIDEANYLPIVISDTNYLPVAEFDYKHNTVELLMLTKAGNWVTMAIIPVDTIPNPKEFIHPLLMRVVFSNRDYKPKTDKG